MKRLQRDRLAQLPGHPCGPSAGVSVGGQGLHKPRLPSSRLLFLLRTKGMLRDLICWPRPEVHPCLNALLYQCRASPGSSPVKSLPSLSPLPVDGSGGPSTGPPCVPPHRGHVAVWPVRYGRPVYSSWFGCKQQHRLSPTGLRRGRTICPGIEKISRV